jgi:YVTN family beta-propeller protein
MRAGALALVMLLASGGLAGCGSSGSKAAHLGCGQFCKQAGAPAGTPTLVSDVRINTGGTVTASSDGTVPVTVTCRAKHRCSGGALLIEGLYRPTSPAQALDCGPGDGCMGRSNLDVAANRTRTIAVPLSAVGRRFLNTYRRIGVDIAVAFPPDAYKSSTWPINVTLDQHAPSGSFVVPESPNAIAVSDGKLWAAGISQFEGIDTATGKLVAKPRAISTVSLQSDSVAIAGGSVWLATAARNGGVLVRLNPATGEQIGKPIRSSAFMAGLAVGQGSLWIPLSNGLVYRLDATTGAVLGGPIRVSSDPPDAIVDAGGSVWVTVDSTVVRIDPASNRVVARLPGIGTGKYLLAVGAGVVWVVNEANATLARIDPATGRLVGAPLKVGPSPEAIAIDGGSVWVANAGANTLTRIDASTGAVIRSGIAAGLDPQAIAISDGSLWVADGGNDLVMRISAGKP